MFSNLFCKISIPEVFPAVKTTTRASKHLSLPNLRKEAGGLQDPVRGLVDLLPKAQEAKSRATEGEFT